MTTKLCIFLLLSSWSCLWKMSDYLINFDQVADDRAWKTHCHLYHEEHRLRTEEDLHQQCSTFWVRRRSFGPVKMIPDWFEAILLPPRRTILPSEGWHMCSLEQSYFFHSREKSAIVFLKLSIPLHYYLHQVLSPLISTIEARDQYWCWPQ